MGLFHTMRVVDGGAAIVVEAFETIEKRDRALNGGRVALTTMQGELLVYQGTKRPLYSTDPGQVHWTVRLELVAGDAD